MDSNNRCRPSCGCGCIALFISAILGAVAGVLVYFNLLPAITTAVWIAFGLGVLGLIILVSALFLASTNPSHALTRCLCKRGICLLVGSIGTIVAALCALSIVLAPLSIATAILVSIAAFFLFLMIIALISFLVCILYHL